MEELWRSFFQDSRFRPVSSKGKRFPIPKCQECNSEKGKEITKCRKCGGSGLDLDNAPTYMDQIESVAQDYPGGEKAIYIIWEDITEFHPRLAINLRWNLDETLKAAKKVVKEFVNSEAEERVMEEHRTEISLDVSPIEIPDALYSEETRNLRKDHLYRMVKVKGLVRKSLPVRPRMEVGVFECTWERHRQHVIQDFFTINEPTRCRAEGCKCTEFKLREELSQFIDSQKLEIQEFPEKIPPGAQPERLTVFAESSLAAQAQPGDSIAGVGVLRPRARFSGRRSRSTEFDIYLYAHSIDERKSDADDDEPTEEELFAMQELSRHPDLRERLSNSIAPAIFGMEWHKAAIILQLFGGVEKKLPDGTHIRGDIHVLMMGDPGVAKSQLLRAAARLSTRGVMATGKSSSAAGLTAAAVRDEFGEGRWTLEAGTLVLANGGLACIDEIDKMSPEDRSAMHEAMEQQTVTIAKAGINAQLPARCSVLAAANPKRSRFDMTRPLSGQVNLPMTLLSRFDIFFIIRDIPNPERDEQLAERVLESHRAGEVLGTEGDVDDLEWRELQPPVRHDLLRKYVRYARKLRPVMTPQAQNKIRDHYTQMRRHYRALSEDDDVVFPITPRQLESIIRLAEADARLHLSDTVGPEHADRAIEIVTEFINITMKGDVGFMYDGMQPKQRKMAEDPRALIVRFVRQAGSEGADLHDILDHLVDQGFSRTKCEKIFQKMKLDGHAGIYEPRPGRYSLQ